MILNADICLVKRDGPYVEVVRSIIGKYPSGFGGKEFLIRRATIQIIAFRIFAKWWIIGKVELVI